MAGRQKVDFIEEVEMLMQESQAIVAFLDAANDGMVTAETNFIDDIHRDVNFGLHLCFEASLERLERARKMMSAEIGKELKEEEVKKPRVGIKSVA